MKRILLAAAPVLLSLAGFMPSASADGILKKHHPLAPPACEPGYRLVEETVMQDVTRTVCKMVPDTKKKWVYSTISEPYCIKDKRCGDDCPQCAGPFCKTLLVKRQVEEPCGTWKCVTETVIERVPVTVYRKVPCETSAVTPGGPAIVIDPAPFAGKKMPQASGTPR